LKPTVLFGILNWGLGHATRTIPLINAFIENDFEVIIASDGDALLFLKEEFPELGFFNLPGYNVKYPYKSIFFNILKYLPNILYAIIRENKEVKKISKIVGPSLIISDNRYGFKSKNIKSIIITHQINLQLVNKILSKAGSALNRKLISSFDELWIPDLKNNLLAGELSKVPFGIKHQYLGPLSRFKFFDSDKKYEIAVVLSGPEPQRSILEEIILEQFAKVKMKSIIILGKINEKKEWYLNDNVKIKNYALSYELNEILNQSELIISRSGYSTIMDLAVLQKKAVLIPTPGQSEQEYLATFFKNKNIFYSVQQDNFDLGIAIKKSKLYYGLKVEPGLFYKIIGEINMEFIDRQ